MVAKPLLSQSNTIAKGYAAFNDADWNALAELLHQNVVWHPMHGGQAISGRDLVLAELQRLRITNEADFLGAAIHDDTAISLDFTHSLDDHGDHPCADKIRFDPEDGSIVEVWHCVTHDDNGGGNPASG